MSTLDRKVLEARDGPSFRLPALPELRNSRSPESEVSDAAPHQIAPGAGPHQILVGEEIDFFELLP